MTAPQLHPRLHPDEATLFAYAGGSLAEGLALAVATHIALCPDCRRASHTLDAIGGAFLDDLAPETLGEAAFAGVLSRLDDPEHPLVAVRPDPRWPVLLGDYVARMGNRWRILGPGIRRLHVMRRTPSGGTTHLLRVVPGEALPHHGHGGREMTVVLEGSFTDEAGRYGPGDFIERDSDAWHRPVAGEGVACVCLIASERPLRFSGFLGRLLQPFLRV